MRYQTEENELMRGKPLDIDCRLGKYLNEIKELKRCLLFKELSYEFKQAEYDVLNSSRCNLLYTQFAQIICYLLSEMEEEKYTDEYALEQYYKESVYPSVVNTIYIVNEKMFEEFRNNEIQVQGQNARQNPIDYVEEYCIAIKNAGFAIVFPDISHYENVGYFIERFESEIVWNNKLHFEGRFNYVNDFLRYITFRQYREKRIFGFDELMDLADQFICDNKDKKYENANSERNYQKISM